MKKNSIVLMFAMLISSAALTSYAQVDASLSIQVAPPELPYYEQPMCPGDGYMWTPGYWAYGYDGYYWVPGVWVYPPTPGYLWTPNYWSYEGGYYGWHAGYWATNVGYYGGVNYGYGYGGEGFGGGRWQGGRFHYNTAVMNVNTTVIHNTYVDRTVIHERENNRPSFNGPGGSSARPTTRDELAAHDRHAAPTAEQSSHQMGASKERDQFANVNHGRPGNVAMNSVNGTRFNTEGHASKVPESHPESDKPAKRENAVASPGPRPAGHSENPARTPISIDHPRINPAPRREPVQPRVNTPVERSTPAPHVSPAPQPQQHVNPAPQRQSPPRQPQQRANPQPRSNPHPRSNPQPRKN